MVAPAQVLEAEEMVLAAQDETDAKDAQLLEAKEAQVRPHPHSSTPHAHARTQHTPLPPHPHTRR